MGPVAPDFMMCRYALVGAWVTIGPPADRKVGAEPLRTQGEIRKDLKEREIVLPFVRPLTTRSAVEIFHAVEGIVRDINALTSEALYPAIEKRVTRVHADCAAEFTGRVAE
eukprot:4834430-Amphidinium_carterae.1